MVSNIYPPKKLSKMEKSCKNGRNNVKKYVILESKSVKNQLKTLPTGPKLLGLLSFTQFYIVGSIAGRVHNVSYVLKKS